MNARSIWRNLSVAAVCSLLIAACGGATTQAPAKEPVKEAPAATAKEITIRWRTRPSDAAEQKVYDELNKLANDKLNGQGIKVMYDPGVNQGYFEKIKTEMAAGNAPDIFWVGGVEVADFASTGLLMDLKPLIDKDSSFKLSDFYKQTIDELTHEGKIYGLPRDISTMVTYYNADLFKAAGIPTPKELADQGKWNWDTLLESAKKLTDPTKQQYGLGFGNWWGPAWGYFVNAAGGSMFNADRTGCGLNTPEALEGAKYVTNLYKEKLMPTGDADSEALFNTGKVGMYFNGRWFTPGVRTNAKFNWDVAEMPMGKVKSTWLFWGPYLVNAKADPAAAWEVLKVITSAEAMGKVAQMGTNIPARSNQEAVDMFLKSTPPENNQAFIKGTAYAAAEAPVWKGNWADYSSKVQEMWDSMIAGKLTPEDFTKQVCDKTASAFTQ